MPDTDTAIEAAAEALWTVWANCAPDTDAAHITWTTLTEAARNGYREEARAAIAAYERAKCQPAAEIEVSGDFKQCPLCDELYPLLQPHAGPFAWWGCQAHPGPRERCPFQPTD